MKGFVIFIIIVILLVIGFAWLGNKDEAPASDGNTGPTPTNDELGLPMAPVAPTAAVPAETLPAASAGVDAGVGVEVPQQ